MVPYQSMPRERQSHSPSLCALSSTRPKSDPVKLIVPADGPGFALRSQQARSRLGHSRLVWLPFSSGEVSRLAIA